jgi:hypothetical protein
LADPSNYSNGAYASSASQPSNNTSTSWWDKWFGGSGGGDNSGYLADLTSMYSAYANRPKKGKFEQMPEDPNQAFVRNLVMQWLKTGSPTQNALQPIAAQQMASIGTPQFNLPQGFDVPGVGQWQTPYQRPASPGPDWSKLLAGLTGSQPGRAQAEPPPGFGGDMRGPLGQPRAPYANMTTTDQGLDNGGWRGGIFGRPENYDPSDAGLQVLNTLGSHISYASFDQFKSDIGRVGQLLMKVPQYAGLAAAAIQGDPGAIMQLWQLYRASRGGGRPSGGQTSPIPGATPSNPGGSV